MKNLVTFSIVTAFASVAIAAPYVAKPDAKAEFEAVGRPSLLKIKGHGAKVSGEADVQGEKVNGKFELALSEFTTGLSLRDRHMKEKYLEVEAHPKATLELVEAKMPAGWIPGTTASDVPFKGILTLKGKSSPVEGKFSVRGEDLQMTAAFEISLSDFPIGVPAYMGVTVADRVKVDVTIPGFTKR